MPARVIELDEEISAAARRRAGLCRPLGTRRASTRSRQSRSIRSFTVDLAAPPLGAQLVREDHDAMRQPATNQPPSTSAVARLRKVQCPTGT